MFLFVYFVVLTINIASPEAQRRNSLEKQLEKLDTDMSLLSRISSLADTLTIAHMVSKLCFKKIRVVFS